MSLNTFRLIAFNKSKYLLQTSYFGCTRIRNYAQSNEKLQDSKSLSRVKPSSDVSTDVKPLGEKVKENAKTASYLGIIFLGVSVTGIMFYAIFRELFSSNSPNSIYSKALEMVINDPRVQNALGSPIKGYGEESRRRRRQHVAHQIYEKNGINHMRMKFHIQGVRNKATVHLEMKENPSGKYDYRYLYVELDYYPRSVIILEDNRSTTNTSLELEKLEV